MVCGIAFARVSVIACWEVRVDSLEYCWWIEVTAMGARRPLKYTLKRYSSSIESVTACTNVLIQSGELYGMLTRLGAWPKNP